MDKSILLSEFLSFHGYSVERIRITMHRMHISRDGRDEYYPLNFALVDIISSTGERECCTVYPMKIECDIALWYKLGVPSLDASDLHLVVRKDIDSGLPVFLWDKAFFGEEKLELYGEDLPVGVDGQFMSTIEHLLLKDIIEGNLPLQQLLP